MVIVNMVYVRLVPSICLSDALVPCGIVQPTVEVIHSCRVWFRFCSFPKDGRVKKHVGDVVDHVHMYCDGMNLIKHLDNHWR